ncbi:hypothetical protein, partial [Desulfobacter sp. UBA2225]|uniref:hypothetical protein n=1 Tax=Desulfobacter sp. UBA2225 TaxID=1961413 RepID=UPI00257F74AC
QGPYQSQPGMAGQMFVSLFDDKFHWNHLHLPGAVFRKENYHKYTIMSSNYIHLKPVLCHYSGIING